MKSLVVVVLLLMSFFSYANAAVTVQHRLGETALTQVPERIVAIGIAAVDTLDYLGVRPVGVAKGVPYPEYLNAYNQPGIVSSGSLFEPDFEAIYNLKPDLIIVGPRAMKAYSELQQIAPTYLYALDENEAFWPATQQQWRNLAALLGKQARIEQTISDIDRKIAAVRQHHLGEGSDALTIMSSGGNITTFGAQSRFAAIYQEFGYAESMKGIKQSRHGDLVSYEFIRDAQPSYLLILDRDKLVNKGHSQTRQQFENALVQATPAYQNKRMIFLDINAWYLAIGGVRATEQMLRDMSN